MSLFLLSQALVRMNVPMHVIPHSSCGLSNESELGVVCLINPSSGGGSVHMSDH